MKILLFFTGLTLLPLCAGVSLALVDIVQMIRPESLQTVPPAFWWLNGGFGLWLLCWFVLPRPLRSYVLAHELTHALWAVLMGSRVLKMRVSKRGGAVKLSKSNFIITLAPYFFPLYTMLLVALYLIIQIFYDLSAWYGPWLGLIGVTWGFHFTFTFAALAQHQSDVHEYGSLFSYSIIYLLNIVGLGLWITAVTPVTLEQWAQTSGERTVQSYRFIGTGTTYLAQKAQTHLPPGN